MDISNIKRIYNGKMGCMCGCNGKYTNNDGSNDRSIKIMAKKILTNPNVVYQDDYAYIEDRILNKNQVVYFS